MFGHVQANTADLTKEDKARYRGVYCGLCHTLNDRHGFFSRLSLTYDLTFLTLLLSSLYEPEETCRECRCIAHPCNKYTSIKNNITAYTADMTIALAYHKCLDDWQDEHKLFKRLYASILSKKYKSVKANRPLQCEAIESGLRTLSQIEKENKNQPDAAANCFGNLMSSVFLYQEDHWEEPLARLGFNLGKYIYIADAAVDYKRDLKKGNYNPLTSLSVTPKELRPILMTILGEASTAFEYLPLVKDIDLLRNILYSGIWIKYNKAMEPKRKGQKHDRRSI